MSAAPSCEACGKPLTTPTRLKVLRALAKYSSKHGFCPSIKDLCALVGVSSTNGMNGLLNGLERDGLLRRTDMTARSIVLTKRATQLLGVAS